MVEPQQMRRLLEEDDETKDEVGSSLQSMTSGALADPRVREMLDAFRSGGPESLGRFLGDPRYDASLDAIRGTARQLEIPRVSAEGQLLRPSSSPSVPSAVVEEEGSGRRPKVLVGVTGSVAAVKVPELVVALSAFAEVKVVATAKGWFFMERGRTSNYDAETRRRFDVLGVPVLRDSDEWDAWGELGDDVLHIELRKWADVIVVAPLSANTLSKLAVGGCDDLLSCILRAWEIATKPMVLAPAMNTAMWTHPFTAGQLDVCKRVLSAKVVDPVAKHLACGDVGIGALAPVSAIVHAVRHSLLLTTN